MKEDVIVRTVSKFMIPLIQLYGLYVIMHGEGGPGGGFQGGVILGASIILYVILFGIEEAKKKISSKTLYILMSLGVLIYAGIGLFCILSGGNYLEYDILPIGSAHKASELGIIGVEIGIGITVFGVMCSIFIDTAER
jgi:multicomponent Na+:H+ antiporter subunit B